MQKPLGPKETRWPEPRTRRQNMTSGRGTIYSTLPFSTILAISISVPFRMNI